MTVEPGSFEDIAQAMVLISLMSLVISLTLALILSNIVALKSSPDRRALWTVAPGILLSVGVCESMAVEADMPFFSILFIALPGLAVWWWFRRQFRRAWIPDDQVPDGTALENDDWRVGVAAMLLLLLAGIFKVIWRSLSGS
jgi:hypothetical protein